MLPPVDLTGDHQYTVTCEGISIGVTMALAQNAKLFVTDQASAFSFRGKNIKAGQAA